MNKINIFQLPAFFQINEVRGGPGLFYQYAFTGAKLFPSLQKIEINTTAQSLCIELNGMPAGRCHPLKDGFNHFTGYIKQMQLNFCVCFTLKRIEVFAPVSQDKSAPAQNRLLCIFTPKK